jgi:hypothetical protein
MLYAFVQFQYLGLPATSVSCKFCFSRFFNPKTLQKWRKPAKTRKLRNPCWFPWNFFELNAGKWLNQNRKNQKNLKQNLHLTDASVGVMLVHFDNVPIIQIAIQ